MVSILMSHLRLKVGVVINFVDIRLLTVRSKYTVGMVSMSHLILKVGVVISLPTFVWIQFLFRPFPLHQFLFVVCCVLCS